MEILLLGGADNGTYVTTFPEDGGRYPSASEMGLTYVREVTTHAGPDVAFPEGCTREQKVAAMKLWMDRKR